MLGDRRSCAVLLLLFTACGEGGDGGADARPLADGGGGRDGAGPVGCASRSGERARAVVLTLVRGGDGADVIDVRTLDDAGRVVDNGLVLPSPDVPRRIAIRADGREALVAYGRFGLEYGVVRLSLEPDGTAAAIEQTLVLGSDETPFGLAYAGVDRAVLALASGPTGHQLVALARTETGDLAPGPSTLIAGDWPLAVLGAGADRAVLLRANLVEDTQSELRPLARDGGGGWIAGGTSGFVGPPSITAALHPDGTTVYSPASDPEHPASLGDLNPPGILHRFTLGSGGLTVAPTFALPNASTQIAAAPDGTFLVLDDAILELPPGSDTPNVSAYHLQTVFLDDAGVPTGATTTAERIEGILFQDLVVASATYLVATLFLASDQIPVGGTDAPLYVWAQTSPGAWERVCDPVFLDGSPTMAIGP